MHLDTVFTLLDRDKATAYPKVVEGIRAISLRPGKKAGTLDVREEKDLLSAVADALGVPKLHVVTTGGDAYQQEREQWDDGNNVVALEPGVVVAYERNTFTIAKMREAGVEVITIEGFELRQGPRRRPLHDLPGRARSDLRRTAPWTSRGGWSSRVIAVDRDRGLHRVRARRGEPRRAGHVTVGDAAGGGGHHDERLSRERVARRRRARQRQEEVRWRSRRTGRSRRSAASRCPAPTRSCSPSSSSWRS